MRPYKNIWQDLAEYGYNTHDLAFHLQVSDQQIELWRDQGWTMPVETLERLRNLKISLLERRYG